MFSDSSIGTAAPKRTVTTQQKCKIDDGEFGFHPNFGFRTRCSDPGDEDDEDDLVPSAIAGQRIPPVNRLKRLHPKRTVVAG